MKKTINKVLYMRKQSCLINKLFVCMFAFCVGSISVNIIAQDAADEQEQQTIYQPFFGQDSTIYYFCGYGGYFIYDDAFGYGYPELGAIQYGVNSGHPQYKYVWNGDHYSLVGNYTYHPACPVDWLFGEGMSYDERRSKVWLRKLYNEPDIDSVLICDMDLSLGESFLIAPNLPGKNVVTKVSWENGYKHIQFDLRLCILVPNYPDEYAMVPYEIVEGVGTLYPDIELCVERGPEYEDRVRGNYDVIYNVSGWGGGRTIRAVVKDGIAYYIHPLWQGDYWDTLSLAGINSPQDNTDDVSISLQGDEIHITTLSAKAQPVTIYDINGRICYSSNTMSNDTHVISNTQFETGVYVITVGKHSSKIWIR